MTTDTTDPVTIWTAHMRRGDFLSAWELNDWLRARSVVRPFAEAPRHQQSVWDGSPVDGRRVLVRCYHGLGDTLQFIRYVPALRARAAHVSVWAQPRLLPLLGGVQGIDRLLPLHDGEPDVRHDVGVEIMELPYLFRSALETIPAAVPYLTIEPLPLPRDGGPAVGLVWTAGEWAAHRSIPFSRLEPLMRAPVTWYVLQGPPALHDRPHDFGAPVGTTDIVEAARAIASLDLLITVDSMPAHLAGALGTRVWTLLAEQADWRWMERREDSPWYPTMRLFRQRRTGDWEQVVERVARELDEFAAAWRRERAAAPAARARGVR